MSKYTIKELIEKYIAGKCTDEEREWIETWYLEQDDNQPEDLSPEKLEIAVDRIWERLQIPVIPARNLQVWYRIAAAASILVFLSAGIYVILHKRQVQQQIAAATGIKNIFPGSNKATLTLAGGRQIRLNGAVNGTLAVEGNATIIKSDGVIAYNINAKTNAFGTATLYNKMTTPRGGQFHLILPDGTHVWLNAASSITYPISFNDRYRKVEVTGEAYFEVAHNKAKPFRVTSNGQTVEVLGTHFNVNVYQDEPAMRTTLYEGAVKVNTATTFAMLKPGQQSVISHKGNNPSIAVSNDADAGQGPAWKNGKFIFNNADIQTVMRQVGRWYDVDVAYAGDIANDHFTGTFSREMDAAKVLKLLEFTGVKFQIKEREIIVK